MLPEPKLPRRWRLAVPVVLAGVAIAAGWVSTLSAGAAPRLRAQTVDQLVSRVEEPAAPGVAGTLVWRADLGLPDLGGAPPASGLDLASLASGTTTADVWYGPAGERVAVLGTGTETDVYDGVGGAWLYDSATDTATRLSLRRAGPGHLPLVGPQLLVDAILAAVPADTQLWEGRPEYVAGRAAYLLELAPQPGTAAARESTVGRIAVAVDAVTGVALAVDVYARGASTPAISLAFTSVRFQPPGAGLVRFSPAPGTAVRGAAAVGRQGGGGLLGVLGAPGTSVRTGWAPVVVLRGRAGAALARTLSSAAGGAAPPGAPRPGAGGAAPPSRRLLETPLINALLLGDGTVALGLATPAVLSQAAGS